MQELSSQRRALSVKTLNLVYTVILIEQSKSAAIGDYINV